MTTTDDDIPVMHVTMCISPAGPYNPDGTPAALAACYCGATDVKGKWDCPNFPAGWVIAHATGVMVAGPYPTKKAATAALAEKGWKDAGVCKWTPYLID